MARDRTSPTVSSAVSPAVSSMLSTPSSMDTRAGSGREPRDRTIGSYGVRDRRIRRRAGHREVAAHRSPTCGRRARRESRAPSRCSGQVPIRRLSRAELSTPTCRPSPGGRQHPRGSDRLLRAGEVRQDASANDHQRSPRGARGPRCGGRGCPRDELDRGPARPLGRARRRRPCGWRAGQHAGRAIHHGRSSRHPRGAGAAAGPSRSRVQHRPGVPRRELTPERKVLGELVMLEVIELRQARRVRPVAGEDVAHARSTFRAVNHSMPPRPRRSRTSPSVG